jgi:hypothetical protein
MIILADKCLIDNISYDYPCSLPQTDTLVSASPPRANRHYTTHTRWLEFVAPAVSAGIGRRENLPS